MNLPAASSSTDKPLERFFRRLWDLRPDCGSQVGDQEFEEWIIQSHCRILACDVGCRAVGFLNLLQSV